MLARLVLPPECCHIGVVGGQRASATKLRLSQSSAISAAIPRLSLAPVSSQTVCSRSSGSGPPFISAILKRHSASSSASVTVSSSSTGTAVSSDPISVSSGLEQSSSPKSVPISSLNNTAVHSASTFASSILKQMPAKCVSISSRSSSIHSNSKSAFVESVGKQQGRPFRTQMILFQQSGRPHLLEISSNCTWEHSRPKLLTRLSDLTKVSEGYLHPCVMSVDGYRVEVQPRSKFPTEIPARLRGSLGISSMFAIRVRITAEEKLSAVSDFIDQSRSLAAAKLSALTPRDCDDLCVGSVCSDLTNWPTTTDLTQQKTGTNTSQQNTDNACPQSTSTVDAEYSVHERTVVDLSQQATATVTSDQQQTSVDKTLQSTTSTADVSRHTESGLSTHAANSLHNDCASVSKSLCPTGSTDGVLEMRQNSLLGLETVGTTGQGTDDGAIGDHGVNTVEDGNHCISATSSCAFSDNAGSCDALQQHGEDAAVIRNDVNSITAKSPETEKGHFRADNGNFPSDCADFQSSSGQTISTANCAEVTCSQQADDGNFSSSSGLSVPIGCPLDLCT